jgi:septal ring-binding cell division protein DamX
VKRNHPGIFQRLTGRPFIFIGWVAAGGACLLLALLVFYPHRYATLSLLSDLKAGPKVFRTKIPEDILIAQNFFRGKFPVVNQPVEIPTKNESLSPVEKKAVPTLPSVALPEQREPNQETGLALTLEIQTKIETTPPLTTAVPTQSADLSSEKIEPPQEIAPYPPAEPQTKIEMVLPTEETSVSSQPNFAPSEQKQLPEKVDPRQAEVRPQPVKDDVIEETQERKIHGEKWLLSQGSSYYTIQLMGARKEALLFNFVERNQLLEQNEIAFYQSTFEDKVWFQLLYGVYVTKKDAQAAADNLPLKIRKSSPWIRRLSAVQKTIRGKMSP